MISEWEAQSHAAEKIRQKQKITLSLLFSFPLYLHSLGAICLGHFYVGVDVGKGEEGG